MRDDDYVEYDNIGHIDRQFDKLKDEILQLKPKEVRDFGISKQLLSRVKHRIRINKNSRIYNDTKRKFLLYFKSQSMKETKKVEELHLVKRR